MSAVSQVEAHGVVEVGGRLFGGEAQVGGSDLDELAPRPQPGERPRRVGSAGDDEVQLLGEMLEEEQHRLVYVEGLDDVVVVEHQRPHRRSRPPTSLSEGGDDGLQRRRASTAGQRALRHRPPGRPFAGRRSRRSRTPSGRCRGDRGTATPAPVPLARAIRRGTWSCRTRPGQTPARQQAARRGRHGRSVGLGARSLVVAGERGAWPRAE